MCARTAYRPFSWFMQAPCPKRRSLQTVSHSRSQWTVFASNLPWLVLRFLWGRFTKARPRETRMLTIKHLLYTFLFCEPPDVGLVPTGVGRVPPPILHCNWRTLRSSQPPFPPPPSPSLFPPPPLALFARLWEGAAQAGGGGGGPTAKGVEGGGGLQAALGARPTSGGTRLFLSPFWGDAVFW